MYYNEEYLVSSDGYVISKRKGTPLKTSRTYNGYHLVNVWSNGCQKTIPLHLAVARTFLGDKTPDGLEVNHIDGNKDNNCLDNLEWITRSENMMHSAHVLGNGIGLKNHKARAIVGYDVVTNDLVYSFPSLSDGARALCGERKEKSVKHGIWRALSGRRQSYLGCRWEYDE